LVSEEQEETTLLWVCPTLWVWSLWVVVKFFLPIGNSKIPNTSSDNTTPTLFDASTNAPMPAKLKFHTSILAKAMANRRIC
jgi:hypothetical protein